MINKMIVLDWRAMKYYQIRGLLVPIFAFIMGCTCSPILVIPFCVITSMSFSVNPFAVEEKGELNNLYLTLPIKRKEIVAGRYALSLIILLIGIIMGIMIMPISNTIVFSEWSVGVEGTIVIVALSFFMYSVTNLFMFPILFKLGYQKGKMWGFYLPAILLSVVIAGGSTIIMMYEKETLMIDFIVYASNNLILVSASLIILATMLLFVSYTISVKLYSKRNF